MVGFVFCRRVPLAAQDPNPGPVTGALRTNLGDCLARANPAVGDGTPTALDAPPAVGTIESPLWFLRNAALCAAAFSGDVILPDYGVPLFTGLAIILVVWTGVQTMFSGKFDVGEVISLVLFIGFPSMILMSYTPAGGAIWGPSPAPLLVMSLGTDVADDLVDGVWQNAQTVVKDNLDTASRMKANAYIRAWQAERAEADGESSGDGFFESSFWRSVTTMVIGMILAITQLIIFVLALIPLLIAYFAYLWGYFSIIIATLIGPIFVPFILFPQTDFLFWGWLRSIFGSTVQVIVGGAVFAIIGQLMLVPLQRFSNIVTVLTMDDVATIGSVFGRSVSAFLEFLPIFIVAYLSAGKVSELAGMILSGGGVPSAGLSDRMRSAGQARSAASGVLAGGAGGARLAAAGVAAGAPLSPPAACLPVPRWPAVVKSQATKFVANVARAAR